MAKQQRDSKPETEAPTEHEEQVPHRLDHDGETSNKVTVEGDWTWEDEDYWAREQEYHDVFDVFQTMLENAMNVGVRWNDIGNFAQDLVYRHAMNQPRDGGSALDCREELRKPAAHAGCARKAGRL